MDVNRTCFRQGKERPAPDKVNAAPVCAGQGTVFISGCNEADADVAVVALLLAVRLTDRGLPDSGGHCVLEGAGIGGEWRTNSQPVVTGGVVCNLAMGVVAGRHHLCLHGILIGHT